VPAQDVLVSTRRRRVSVRTSILLDKLYHVSEQNPHPGRPVHDEGTAVSVPAAGIRPQAHQGGRPAHRATAYHALTLRRQTGIFVAVLSVYFAARCITNGVCTGWGGRRIWQNQWRHWGSWGRTAPGDTLQGVTPEGKNFFVGEFTKNSGQTRSER